MSLPHLTTFSIWRNGWEIGGGVRWRDKARGKDVCGGGHPLGTDYLPPDCWTGTDNKKILIVHSQGAVTRGGKGEGGTFLSCYVAEGKSKRGLDRDNKTPGISPYGTLAEKLISVYLFRHHFSGRQGGRYCFLPKVVGCQNAGREEAEGYK